ncbi:MAG: hypothetical protein J5642_04355 [Bacteroidales bacterium]|nr:hypothetical protein [Bacteroidales bacterium]
MMWKRFTVSLLAFIACAHTWGCVIIWDNLNYGPHTYMFKSFEGFTSYGYADPRIPSDILFWHDYVHGKVDKSSVESALYDCQRADMGQHPFFRLLEAQNDTAALKYWRLVKSYSELGMDDPWYYPTPSDLATLRQTALQMKQGKELCQNPLLKERFVLQLMRISFYLHNYTLCQQVWEDFPGPWKQETIRYQCLSYYAGALFHLGQNAKAADLFCQSEDWNSLKLFKNSPDLMEELYQYSPSSEALCFFIQDFLNTYQDHPHRGKAEKFNILAQRVLKERKTNNPALWQSATAHLAFLQGDIPRAVQLIEQAAQMDGTPIVKENVRLLSLLYHAADYQATDYDEKLNADLPWLLHQVDDLEELCAPNGLGDHHYVNLLRRVIHQFAVPYYITQGNINLAVALLNAMDEVCCWEDGKKARECNRKNGTGWNYDYSTAHFNYLDTAPIEQVLSFIEFAHSGGNNNLEKSILKICYINDDMLNELVGTKYMRQQDYDHAIEYLQKASHSFQKRQNIDAYLLRNPFIEAWIDASMEKRCYPTHHHPADEYAAQPTKLQYCKIMRGLLQQIEAATTDEEQAALHYIFAVGLVQSYRECTMLTQYVQGHVWSGFQLFQYSQYLTGDQWDYATSSAFLLQGQYLRILQHLQEAERLTGNRELKARCQYLRCYIEPDKSTLARLQRQTVSQYKGTQFHMLEIAHCDVLTQYQ